MTFQSSAFQNSGFQVDEEGGARPTGGNDAVLHGAYWPKRDTKARRVVVERQPDNTMILLTLLETEWQQQLDRRNKAVAALLLAAV